MVEIIINYEKENIIEHPRLDILRNNTDTKLVITPNSIISNKQDMLHETIKIENVYSVTYSESNIIIRCVERNDNVNSIKLQFDNRETYINSALTIISCIRDAHKEIDIMGSCIVY